MSTHKATILWQEPPTVEDARAAKIKQIKAESYRRLLPSDWLVVRYQEQGVAIPQQWTDYRAAVRAASDQAEADVAALTTVDEIRAYRPTWPEAPQGVR